MAQEEQKKKKERGTRDDWESLKVVLDQQPNLKQRVLLKIKEMRAAKEKKREGIRISKKEALGYRLEQNSKTKE